MGLLSNTILQLKPSPTLAVTARANQLKAQGQDIIGFGAGEPDFDTPEHIKQAAIEALQKGFTKYTAVGGIPALKDTIQGKLKREQDISYAHDQIIITNGGKQAIATACAVLLNPGDEVIIPAPYWTSYPDMAVLAGGKPVFVNTLPEDGFLMSAEQLKKACSSKTKLIFINSPSNPTGSCYTKEQLKELANVISSLPNRNELIVITDEVYEYITFDGFKHVSFLEAAPELRDRTLLVNAFSKAYSMTGWRVGYAVGPKEVITAMTTHVSQFTSNVCSIAQYAAARAYDDNYAFPRMMQVEFNKRVNLVADAVSQMSGIRLAKKPDGAFFGFMLIDGLLGKKNADVTVDSSATFAEYLLEKFQVAAVAGEAFGYPGAIRISFALNPKDLERGLDRIKKASESFF